MEPLRDRRPKLIRIPNRPFQQLSQAETDRCALLFLKSGEGREDGTGTTMADVMERMDIGTEG